MSAIPRAMRLQLAALRRLDDHTNILYLTYDWVVIALAAAAAIVAAGLAGTAVAIAVYLAAITVIGSRQRALMNLVHEASHRKLFRTRKANDWAGRLFASFPLAASLDAYVCGHCRHHGHLWDRNLDPKTSRYAHLGLVRAPRRLAELVRTHVLKPALLLHVPFNVRGALTVEGEPRSERLARIAFWCVLIAAVVATGQALVFVALWVVPFLTTFQVIRYWTEMAEHAGLDADNPWMATRNWTGSLPARWLLAPHRDDQYHLVHHLLPRIPHYRLAEAHRLLMHVPEYAAAHHCDGFFFARRPDAPSVLQDIAKPDEITRYKALPAHLRTRRRLGVVGES
jgi:fatty acid desaturase